MMWLLVMLLFSPTAPLQVQRTVVLNDVPYPTRMDCREERDRIQEEMEKAYPDDTSFLITCVSVPKKV